MTSNISTINVTVPALFGQRTLHLFTLCGFAFTGPLLTAFAGQTVFIHDQQFGALEVGVLLLILMIALPIGFVLVDRLAFSLSRWTNGWGRSAAFTILLAIINLSLLRPYVIYPPLVMSGTAGLVALAVAIAVSCLATFFYERTNWMKSWATFASVGLILFPAIFLWQFQSILRIEKDIRNRLKITNAVPVVLIIFDEFSSISMMNDRMEIDARQFPQFQRLAGLSTWYRNATTMHPRTDMAVPSILSGRLPTITRAPLASEYPGNLLQVIDATKVYDMAVFEPISRLAPLSVKRQRVRNESSVEKTIGLVQTLSAVYPRLIFTNDTPIWFPTIPRRWFGVKEEFRIEDLDFSDLTEGLFNYPGSEARYKQFEHFLNCLIPSERPRFCFLHTVFPHFPWCFFSTGEQYLSETSTVRFPTGATGELGEDWQRDAGIVLRNQFRYQVQLQYADTLIGQVLDRLQEVDQLDRCLLIVTADHGVSFRPGHSRRLPDSDSLADILSVPLFIKLPGQKNSLIDDRNVESVDLLPTIAEVLGVELPDPVDGIPISHEQRRPRKTLYFERTMTVVEPDLPQRAAAVQRQVSLFGNKAPEEPPAGLASHPEWHGRTVDQFRIDGSVIPVRFENPFQLTSWDIPLDLSKTSKCFVTGTFQASELFQVPADLVVAVNGVICDTGRSYRQSQTTQGFEFLLPKSSEPKVPSQIQMFVVDSSQTQMRLRPAIPVVP